MHINTRRGRVLVDAADHAWLSCVKWHIKISAKGYISCCNSHHKAMSRIIMNAKIGQIVDHRNGDTLDNRRSNLRICDAVGSNQNRGITRVSTSGRKGVTWNRKSEKWQAQIKAKKRCFYLGLFTDLEAAAAAYRRAARRLHGEFARMT